MKKIPMLLTAAAAALVLAACSSTSSTAPASTTPTTISTSSTTASSALVSSGTTSTPTSSASSSPASTDPATGSDSGTAAAGGETAITLTIGDQVINATLNDTQVAQDFIATLPITLPWSRNSGIEYITELTAPLTESGPFYTDVQPGDLVYYNPLDSITIIYQETSSVPTLTKMGEITSDLSVFRSLPDDVDMRIALG